MVPWCLAPKPPDTRVLAVGGVSRALGYGTPRRRHGNELFWSIICRLSKSYGGLSSRLADSVYEYGSTASTATLTVT